MKNLVSRGDKREHLIYGEWKGKLMIQWVRYSIREILATGSSLERSRRNLRAKPIGHCMDSTPGMRHSDLRSFEGRVGVVGISKHQQMLVPGDTSNRVP